MNTVYFANHGAIDLDLIRLMGVSVKEGENPIGFFGTGLKYSIATLLRNGQSVTLHRNGTRHTFHAKPQVVRGQSIDIVWMNEEQLAFSTQLGKNWEIWQAFRELYSNMKDEGGIVTDNATVLDQYDTVIEVRGKDFFAAYCDRGNIVLDSTPIHTGSEIEIHPGQSRVGFYRGIRAHSLPQTAMYRYNLTRKAELTEDRTIKYSYMFESTVHRAIVSLTDTDLIEKFLFAPKGSFEAAIDYTTWCASASPEFFAAVKTNRFRAGINQSAVALWREHDKTVVEYDEFTPSGYELRVINEAIDILQGEAEIDLTTIKWVKTLGQNILGVYRKGQIYISRDAIEAGPVMLAGTLWEEYLHAERGFDDESRSFQNFLINKCITMMRERRERD